jgi:hypothetical protein
MAENAALQFAHFSISGDGVAFLKELQLDAALLERAKTPLIPHSFAREFELIANYSDTLAQKAKAKCGDRKKQSVGSGKDTAKDKPEAPIIPPTIATPDISKDISMTVAPILKRQRSLDEREYTVLSMMERCGEDKDVCFFYLESMGWDLEAALELLKSMAVK